MKSQVVGQVTESEKKEILILNERLDSLRELKLCKDDLDIDEGTRVLLLRKVCAQEIKTQKGIKKWWQEKSCKYKWKKDDAGYWVIEFKTNNVVLHMM
ncbi:MULTISPECIES: CXXX repeat peptide modification system protein [Haloimpatiens]|uniref:CXXX repeat peptide modification system protein n=1 Tax=Haloimpatiens TaxID=1755832 RepID=UPI0014859586|nr:MULTISPECIES: CXXX repeat peptide modification system protein [Haloimpatiens]